METQEKLNENQILRKIAERLDWIDPVDMSGAEEDIGQILISAGIMNEYTNEKGQKVIYLPHSQTKGVVK